MKLALMIAAEVFVILGLAGCAAGTQDRKDWIDDGASCSGTFAALTDKGRAKMPATTPPVFTSAGVSQGGL